MLVTGVDVVVCDLIYFHMRLFPGGGGLMERRSIRGGTGMVVSDSLDGVMYQNYDQDNGSVAPENVRYSFRLRY